MATENVIYGSVFVLARGFVGWVGLCKELGALEGVRCYFLVSEQESNQRSRLKGR